MKRVVMTPNPYRDMDFACVRQAKALLEQSGVEVRVCLAFDVDPGFPMPQNVELSDLREEMKSADALICFGGDGTILHSSKLATRCGVPILGVNIGTVGFMAELESGEMELLIGRQMEPVIHHPHVYRADVVRTFGDDDGIRLQGARRQIAQGAPGEHVVVYIEMVVWREQHRESASYSPMLHRVVEHDHIQRLQLAFELFHTPHPALAHSYRHLRESAVQLHRLVPYALHGRGMVRHDEAARSTFVAPREDRRMIAVLQQQADDIRRHGRLARPAYRYIADTYRSHIHGERRQQMPVKEHMAEGYTCGVEPGERYV